MSAIFSFPILKNGKSRLFLLRVSNSKVLNAERIIEFHCASGVIQTKADIIENLRPIIERFLFPDKIDPPVSIAKFVAVIARFFLLYFVLLTHFSEGPHWITFDF